MSKRDSGLYDTGQMSLISTKSDVSRFDNFLLGQKESNKELLNLLQKMVADGEPTPCFLQGISGSGKTHLLSATLRSLQEKGVGNVFYFDLRNPAISPELIRNIEKPNFICMDNVDAWAGDVDGEQALFSIVERAKQNVWPILIAANNKPSKLGINLADLVSRLSSGVVYGVAKLDEETTFAAIQLRAKERGLVIQDDAIRYLLTHYARDNKTLFATIDRLDKASLVAKRKVTVRFLQQVLNG